MSDTPPTVESPPATETSEERLRATIARLQAEGHLSEVEAERMQRELPETLKNSAYVIRHLAVHWAMAAVFAVDFIPFLGTISRVVWVMGNRVVETVRGRWEHASVHSLPVLGVAAIPWVGYFAYLIPLRSRSADAAFLYANHFTYTRSDCALTTYLDRRPKWIARIVRKLVGVPATSISQSEAIQDEAKNDLSELIPTGSQTVAGGRSAAETTGTDDQNECTPEGCQKC